LNQGAYQEAHQLAMGVPSDSPDRQSSEFLAVEEAWAKNQLAAAARETNREARRALLDQVARASGVSLELRNRATAEIQSTNAEAVDLSDLGKTSKAATRP
jgi:hypothetical protein